MSTICEKHTDESIDLDQMISFMDALGENPLGNHTEDVMLALRKLCNNKTFIVEKLEEQMKNLEEFEKVNPYSSQVFLLHISEHYSIRAVIWEPESGRVGEDIFFYDDFHDHNFELLTIGYKGSGYHTVLYDYDYDAISGIPNEKVQFRNKKNLQLSENTILLMDGSFDIHSQYPPQEFSVSLNIMQINRQDLNIQYEFTEPNPKTLESKLLNPSSNFDVESIAQCLATFNCKQSSKVIEQALETETVPKKRVALFNALFYLKGKQAWEVMAKDADKAVAKRGQGMLAL